MTRLRSSLQRVVGKPDSAHRERFHFWWLAVTLAYGGARIAVTVIVLAKYGVNPWVFAAIELVSSVLYGVASPRLIGALVDGDRQKRLRFGALTFVGFIAPDLYIVASGHHVPTMIYVVLGIVVAVTGVITVRGLRAAARRDC